MSGKKPAWKTDWNQKDEREVHKPPANQKEKDKSKKTSDPSTRSLEDAVAAMSLDEQEEQETDGKPSYPPASAQFKDTSTKPTISTARRAGGGVAGSTQSSRERSKSRPPIKFSGPQGKSKPAPISNLIPPMAMKGVARSLGQSNLTEDEILAKYLKHRLSLQHMKNEASTTSTGAVVCPRPSYGSFGTAVQVYSNHFAIIAKNPLYLYALNFADSTSCERKTQKRRLERFEIVHPSLFQNTAIQGLQIVSPKKLEDDALWPYCFHGSDDVAEDQDNPQSQKRYSGSVQFTREIPIAMFLDHLSGNFNPGLDMGVLIQCLNIVLGQYPRAQNHLNPTLNKYFEGNDPAALGIGVVAMKGFFSSVRPSAGGLQCNINVCTSAFLEGGNFARIVRRVMENNNNNPSTAVAILNKSFRGCKVLHRYTGHRRIRTIYSLEAINAHQYTFLHRPSGRDVTVAEYFLQEYNVRLQYPAFPLVNVSNRERPVFLPTEVLEIQLGQRYKGLEKSITEQMIKHACKGPQSNMRRILETGLRVLGHHPQLEPEKLDLSTKFGISVSPKIRLIPARILAQPSLSYGNRAILSAQTGMAKGAWNLTAKSFYSCPIPQDLTITVCNLTKEPGNALRSHIIQPLVMECRRLGLKHRCFDIPNMRYCSSSMDLIESNFEAISKNGKKNMIIVLLASGEKSEYAKVKYLGDIRFGMHTVCIQTPRLLQKQQPSKNLLGNIAMKLNFKLGGINHILSVTPNFLKTGKVMIMGMDLTHASPSSLPGAPSIAGVVASYDLHHVNFPASLRLQTAKEDGQGEVISELKAMVYERLKFFQSRNGKALPRSILVYRDGVGEGEYLKMLYEEIPQIQEAWKQISREDKILGEKPKITFVVCGKRHHTRLYPYPPNVSTKGSEENCFPGTTVDRGITSPYEFEWFSQSHKGIHGTTRPTHYVVLKDDNSFSADALQEITHNLCYTFARCTSSVSVCPPVYYADIACERGRHYLDSIYCPSQEDLKRTRVHIPPGTEVVAAAALSSVETRRVKQETMNRAREIWKDGVHPNMKSVMFYL